MESYELILCPTDLTPDAEGQVHRTEARLRSAAHLATSLGVRVVPHVVVGLPYREVLGYAEANAIDLISMGAKGCDFGARSLIGSNSDRVLRQARCPGLIARPLRPALGAPLATRSLVSLPGVDLHRSDTL